MLLNKVPFWVLWTFCLTLVVIVSLAANTLFNDTEMYSEYDAFEQSDRSPKAKYCGAGLEDITDDEEYDRRRRELPVTMPRAGRWIVFASDATPEQSSIAVPWRRKAQLSRFDVEFGPEVSLCGAYPTIMRPACDLLITKTPFVFNFLQRMTYATHSLYATYLYYRWRLDCGMLDCLKCSSKSNH